MGEGEMEPLSEVVQKEDKLEDKCTISTVLERLLMKKSKAEVLIVGDDRLLVTCEPCPPVLATASKHKSEIILVQQHTQQSKRLASYSSLDNSSAVSHAPAKAENGFMSPIKSQSTNEDLDVTGSPLKCPFMQDMSEADFSPFTISLPSAKKTLNYMPVSSARAGIIASKFNMAMRKMVKCTTDSLPLWVASDGKDNQGTVFIGVTIEEDGANTRTLVRSAGPYLGWESLPSMDHLTHHHTAIGHNARVNSCVEATYNVMTSKDEEKESSLRLICCWKRPMTMLSPPAPDSLTTACVRVVCEDSRSEVYQMYQELSVLMDFVCGLKSGEVMWLIQERSSTIAEDLQQLFSSIKDKDQRETKEEENKNECELQINGKLINKRQAVDFTDRLWSILMRCESYQELKESLELVFSAVESEEVRPQVHVRNTTQVGMVLRNLMRGRESVPKLTGLIPLIMLVELGCEKVKRDYINIFQNGELATGEQLSWFVSGCGGMSGGDSEDTHEVVVKQLGRLHVTLQVAMIFNMYLNLDTPELAHVTTQVLNQMKEEEPGPSHSFSLKLETSTVHQMFDCMKVNTWEVTLSSGQSSYSKSMVCHVSRTPLLQLVSTLPELEEDLKEEEDKEEQFYCNYFTSVTDKYFV